MGTTGHPLLDGIIGLAAVLTALLAIWGFRQRVLRPIRWLVRDLTGEPARPGHPAVPSLSEQVAAMRDTLAVVDQRTRQLEGNGGGHLADKIHAIDSRTEQMTGDVEHLKDRAQQNAEGINALHERVNGVDQRVTDHRAAQAEQARLLAERLDRMEADRLRAETYAASLQELGIDVDIPKPEGGT